MKLKNKTFLTPSIILLAAISFFTDISSEMIFPILPLYLIAIGYSPLTIGILEGASELIFGFFKLFFAIKADKSSNPNLFIKLGYTIAAFAKPLIGLTTFSPLIFGGRILDRFSKSMRSAPRDAILVRESTPATRGRTFGFHRAMDTLGATLGPIVTLVILYFFLDSKITTNLQLIFGIAFIPGIIASYLTFKLKDTNQYDEATTNTTTNRKGNILTQILSTIKETFQIWQISSSSFKSVLITCFLTALIAGGDMFYLLRLREFGLDATQVLMAYIGLNITTTLLAYPVGRLLDKINYKNIYLLLMILLSFNLTLLSFKLDIQWVILSVLLYSTLPLLNEIVLKSWISVEVNAQSQSRPATIQGFGLIFQSLGSFVSSIAIGYSWLNFGSSATYNTLALLTLIPMMYVTLTKFTNISAIKSDIIACNPKH